jgi:hypothetical protein
MRKLLLLGLALIVFSGLSSASASAIDWTPRLGAGGYLIGGGTPTVYGGEAAVLAQFQPLAEHELYIGPKVGALLAWGSGGITRFDVNFGISETLWVVNAIGGGVDLDLVAPSTITGGDTLVNFRFTPYAAVRLLHFGSEGAWGLRLGVPYDTHYKWAVQLGVTLQLNGLPLIGESSSN